MAHLAHRSDVYGRAVLPALAVVEMSGQETRATSGRPAVMTDKLAAHLTAAAERNPFVPAVMLLEIARARQEDVRRAVNNRHALVGHPLGRPL